MTAFVFPQFPMPIVSPNVIIRPPTLADVGELTSVYVDSYDMIKQTMAVHHKKPTPDEVAVYVKEAMESWKLKDKESAVWLTLLIFDKHNQLVGETGYHHINWDELSLEFGGWISRQHLSKGYMTEASIALIQYAFKQLGIKNIHVVFDHLNTRSIKIAERLGFVHAETLKDDRISLVTNRVSDTLIYTMHDMQHLPELTVSW